MLEINVGTRGEPQPLFVSNLLNLKLSVEIIDLLCDCFAWDYHEMLGLPRGLVERKLKIKDRFKPFQQPPPAIFCQGTIKSQRRNLTSSQSRLYVYRLIC